MAKLEKIIEWGFYFFIFLLPWQTRLIWQEAYFNGYVSEYSRFSLYGTEILLWLVLFLYGFWLFKNRYLEKLNFSLGFKRLKDPAVLIYWLTILFLLSAGMTVIWSLNASLAYYRFVVLAEAIAMFSMILVFGRGLKSGQKKVGFSFEKIAIVWVLSAAIQGLFATWQFFVQYTFANKWLGLAEHFSTVGGSIILQTDSERWLRAYGSLPHPNILAGFLVIGLLFLIYLALVAEKRSSRVFVLASLLMITPGLFFTFSRSAWVALIVVFGFLSVWLFRQDKIWQKTFFKMVFLLMLIFIVLGINLWQPVLTRIQGEQDLEVASIYLRVAFTKQAFELIKDNPILGQGIGNYTLAVFQKINASWPGYYYQPVHNIYLLVLAELGIFGALIFGLILIILIWNLLKKNEAVVTSPHLLSSFRLEKIIVFLCLLSILIISLFDHYFFSLYFGLLIFWLILALNLKQLNQ